MLESLVKALVCATTGVVLQFSSCSSGVGVGVDVDDGGVNVNVDVDVDGDGGGSGAVVPADALLVRFANRTQWALDVEFFATAEIGGEVETVLFATGNQIAEGIGFAGTGLIPTDTTDTLTLTCADAAQIGTGGGLFVDADSGEELGAGQRRVAAVDLQYTCGEIITFIYDTNGDTFVTAMLIE